MSRPDITDGLGEVCQQVLGAEPDHIEFPGGRNRKSARIHLGDRALVVSRRRSAARAELEAGVLRELHEAGAPVPELIGHQGEWVFQSNLDGERLTIALHQTPVAEREALLGKALESIARYQHIGTRLGLHQRVQPIGATRDDWALDLANQPKYLARQAGLPLPDYDSDKLAVRLHIAKPRFIKWDTRAGNAHLCGDGQVRWFDWEHAGARHPIDDVVWLLGDENLADLSAEAQRKLLSAAFPLLDVPVSELPYAFLMGTLHMSVRLLLIIDRKGDEAWWNPQTTLELDRIGVVQARAVELARRAERWSHAADIDASVPTMFAALAAKFEQL